MSKTKKGIDETVKEMLADPTQRIRLDDYVIALLRETIPVLSSDEFLASPQAISSATIQARLNQYEDAVKDLVTVAALLGRWARTDQLPTLLRMFCRLAESAESSGGIIIWQNLRWYPLSLLTYATGIAALSARNHPALGHMLLPTAVSNARSEAHTLLVVCVADKMNEIAAPFKALPGHDRDYVPRSEYTFDLLRKPLDDLLYLGDSYEILFDQFEIISTLAYADLTKEDRGRIWAAPGRFAWKHRQSRSPYDLFVREAQALGDGWQLLREGFFGSSPKRFTETAQSYREFMNELRWG